MDQLVQQADIVESLVKKFPNRIEDINYFLANVNPTDLRDHGLKKLYWALDMINAGKSREDVLSVLNRFTQYKIKLKNPNQELWQYQLDALLKELDTVEADTLMFKKELTDTEKANALTIAKKGSTLVHNDENFEVRRMDTKAATTFYACYRVDNPQERSHCSTEPSQGDYDIQEAYGSKNYYVWCKKLEETNVLKQFIVGVHREPQNNSALVVEINDRHNKLYTEGQIEGILGSKIFSIFQKIRKDAKIAPPGLLYKIVHHEDTIEDINKYIKTILSYNLPPEFDNGQDDTYDNPETWLKNIVAQIYGLFQSQHVRGNPEMQEKIRNTFEYSTKKVDLSTGPFYPFRAGYKRYMEQYHRASLDNELIKEGTIPTLLCNVCSQEIKDGEAFIKNDKIFTHKKCLQEKPEYFPSHTFNRMFPGAQEIPEHCCCNDKKAKEAAIQEVARRALYGAEPVDIKEVASKLRFYPVTKKAINYQFIQNGEPNQMPALSYTQVSKQQNVDTMTSDGKETQNVANVGDILLSGPSKENYVIKADKFKKLYKGEIGQTVTPEQNERLVAMYPGPVEISFMASWGEQMICKPGDYLVKDGEHYYRIAKVEFEKTYNMIKTAALTVTIPDFWKPIVDKLQKSAKKHKYKVYIAGGFVRDLLLKKDPHDLDVTITSIIPGKTDLYTAYNFARDDADDYKLGKPDDRSNQGTTFLNMDGQQIDFAAPRTDKYTPGDRKPDVEPADLKKDALRRDFGMNALYIDISNNEVLDETGHGIADIQNKIIRITDPGQEDLIFSQDPLRLLRVIVQSAKLNFTIAPEVWEAVKRNAHQIKTISSDRIQAELTKMLHSGNKEKTLELLDESGLLDYVLPEMRALKDITQPAKWHHKDVWNHTKLVGQNIEKFIPSDATENEKTILRLAAWLHDIGKPESRSINEEGDIHFFEHDVKGQNKIRDILFKRLNYPLDIVNAVEFLVGSHMRPHSFRGDWTDKAVRKFTAETAPYTKLLLALAKADVTSARPERAAENIGNITALEAKIVEIAERDKDKASAIKPLLDGNVLMKMYPDKKAGPWIRDVHAMLLEKQQDAIDAGKEMTVDEAKVIVDQFMKEKGYITSSLSLSKRDGEFRLVNAASRWEDKDLEIIKNVYIKGRNAKQPHRVIYEILAKMLNRSVLSIKQKVEKLYKLDPELGGYAFKHWNREDIIKAIQQMYLSGETLNRRLVPWSLRGQIENHSKPKCNTRGYECFFESWDDCMAEALYALEYKRNDDGTLSEEKFKSLEDTKKYYIRGLKKSHQWGRAEIVELLKEIDEHNLPATKAFITQYPDLYTKQLGLNRSLRGLAKVVEEVFGSWGEALIEAGIAGSEFYNEEGSYGLSTEEVSLQVS